ncbi:MAG TPA: hypothetical protein VJG83_05955 [archaeon]|nr:hypothetical protein [archaeon]
MALVILVVTTASALQQLLSMHGRLTNGGTSVTSADLRVGIYDAATGGNIVYDSGTDYNGTVINGIVDVMLGDGSVSLDLNYGTLYYMDININNATDLDFNGSERMRFESPRGNDANISDIRASGAATPIRLFTGAGLGTERIRITSDGNVAIGSQAPASRFVVTGYGVSSASSAMNITTINGASILYVRDDNRVGIRTTSPTSTLNVLGDVNISSTSSPSLIISSSDGNIVIGATAATSTFRVDIAGFTRITGDLNVGKKITTQDLNIVNTATLNGDLNISTLGKKIIIKDQNVGANDNFSNACMGSGRLTSGGVTITTTCITENSRVFLTRQSGGLGNASYGIGGRTAGTSFDINSSYATDANSIAWMIVEPA